MTKAYILLYHKL